MFPQQVNPWQTKKVLISIKTYPNPSMQYQETVCTAGVTDKGEWIRLYPITFRYLPYDKQFKKYHWIEVDVKKHNQDIRPESFRPNLDSIKVINECSTKNKWLERKKILLPLSKSSLEEINQLYDKYKISLGMFKPKEILDFYWNKTEDKWSNKHEAVLSQLCLFGNRPKQLEKVPYDFRYKFRCDDSSCKGNHDLRIIDWEIFQAYRDWRNKYESNTLLDKIKEKWLNYLWAPNRDSYFIVGSRHPYPTFMILGVFWPPK